MERRSYKQYCGLARSLDLVGERWTLLVVRNLLTGPKRYKDLLGGLPGITTNLLAQRLRDMEEAGLVRKVRLPRPASALAYDLTELGSELEPVVHALGAFGTRHLLGTPRPGDRFDLGWAMLALKRRYRGGGRRAVVEVRTGDRVFQVRSGGPALEVREELRWEPDAVVTGGADGLRRLLLKGEPAQELVAQGRIEVHGDAGALEMLLALLTPPGRQGG